MLEEVYGYWKVQKYFHWFKLNIYSVFKSSTFCSTLFILNNVIFKKNKKKTKFNNKLNLILLSINILSL